MFVAIGHTPNTGFLNGKLDDERQGLYSVDEAISNTYQCAMACLPPVMSPMTTTDKPSPQPVPAAWRPSMWKDGWSTKELTRVQFG